VFCMQYGPGAENAFPGVATAYSDSTPMLLLPLGHPRDRAQVFPLFSSARTYASVTKSVETITVGTQVADVMRRAISLMRMGRPGPGSGHDDDGSQERVPRGSPARPRHRWPGRDRAYPAVSPRGRRGVRHRM